MLRACLNGGRTRDFHPGAPYSPDALAAHAQAAVAAGARELLIRPRDADRLESLEPADFPRLLHGSDATTWPLYREALRLGLDGRIGLEDGALLPSGAVAAGNAELITAARALAHSF